LSLPKTCTTAVLPQLEPVAWFGSRTHPKNFLNSTPQMLDQPFIVSPSWQTVIMEILGNLAAEAGAPHGVTALAAAVPVDAFSGEVFPFDEFAGDCFASDDFPYGADQESAYPEDPFPGGEYPDGVFPEDPFPEALFYEASFTGGDPSGGDAPGLGLDNRVGAVKRLLRADLTADGPGLIDQTTALEKFKRWATGQQARLAVEFEARQRQEQAEFATVDGPAQSGRSALSAEELGRKRPKDACLGVAEQIALARGESPHRGGRLLGMAKALVIEMPHTLTAMDTGRLSEEKAMHVVKETACLTVEDRAAVDEELAAEEVSD
jgi:hypothetical protein